MQVDAVRQAGRHAAEISLSIYGEERLEDGVNEEQGGIPGRDLRVARHEQDAELGQHEAEEVGATIPQEDEAVGIVPDQKAQDRPDHDERAAKHERVPHLEGHVAERGEHGHGRRRREAVEAIDDVDGIDQRCHAHHGRKAAGQRQGEPRIHQRHVHPDQAGIEYDGAQRAACQRAQQPHRGADALGEVFREANAEHHGRTGQEERQVLGERQVARRQHPDGQAAAEQDAHAAYAGHRPDVEFLDAGEIAVRCGAVAMAHADDEEGGKKRNDETDRQVQHVHSCGWSQCEARRKQDSIAIELCIYDRASNVTYTVPGFGA